MKEEQAELHTRWDQLVLYEQSLLENISKQLLSCSAKKTKNVKVIKVNRLFPFIPNFPQLLTAQLNVKFNVFQTLPPDSVAMKNR